MHCCLEPQGQHCARLSLCRAVWSLSNNISLSFDLCNVVPRELRQHLTRLFLMQGCLEPLGQHCIGSEPAQYRPESIKWQHWTRFFHVHCCLEHQGQHCIRFLSEQHYPNITISWDHNAQEKPYIVLSLRLQTTFHKKKSCSMLP